MYLMNPTTALDLARARIDQDLLRAEARRRAHEVKAAGKAAHPRTPRRRRRLVVGGAVSLRFGH
jgi:hypothetical protein